MRFVITSKKGGVGKSTIAKELAYKYNMNIVNLDSDSFIKDNFTDLNITNVQIGDLIPKEIDTIYDFPAGDIFELFPNTKKIIKKSDIIFIPTIYGLESVTRAINTYHSIKDTNPNIIFVLNQFKNDEEISEAKEMIEEEIADEAITIVLPYSKGMENSEMQGVSIFELANKNKLTQYQYKKMIKGFENMFDIIEEVI